MSARRPAATMNDSGREALRLDALRRVRELEDRIDALELELGRAREHLALYESDCD